MTRGDLVALISRDGALAAEAVSRFSSTAQAKGLAVQHMDRGSAVAVRGPAAVGTRAAAVGEMFAHHSHFPQDLAAMCREAEQREPFRIDALSWGSFLFLEIGRASRRAILTRSSFGDLPCFWIEDGPAVLAATSPALLDDFAEAPLRIDWAALGRYLQSPEMRTPATCLQGVRELPGGHSLEIGPNEITLRETWSPWSVVARQDPSLDLQTAARRLGTAIDSAVAARCKTLAKPVLLLSGGVDSSTLAAALRESDTPFSALTMVTRQRSGDERDYARAVAATTAAPLTECMRELDAIDWSDRTPHRHARPSTRLFRQATLAAAGQLARTNGADTILDGAGGDNLFCSLQSVVPLLDRYAAEGWRRGVWRTARAMALRSQVPIGTVLAAALRRRASGRIAYRWPSDPSFLGPDYDELTGEGTSHPWLDPPSGTLPGQAAHVALILGALHLAEDASTDPSLRTMSPLVARPVVEAVLQIPSWLWFEDGRNRAAVRRAYSDRLPPIVLARTGKGTPAGFMTEIVEANRDHLRALLLDGLLVAHGVADRGAIERALAASGLVPDNGFDRLLVIADAERWARLWH